MKKVILFLLVVFYTIINCQQTVKVVYETISNPKISLNGAENISESMKEEMKTKLQVTAYDEVLLNLDQGVRPKSLNQNWMFLGLKYRINDKMFIRSGYHDVYLKLNSDSFVTNHIWETTLTYKII